MTYRFFVAVAVTLLLFPFAMVYSFQIGQPDAEIAFNYETWLSGFLLVLFGWVVFLAPGLIPFYGTRYYAWVGRISGLTHTVAVAQERAGSALKAAPRPKDLKAALAPSALKAKVGGAIAPVREQWVKRRSSDTETTMANALCVQSDSSSVFELAADAKTSIQSKVTSTLSRLKSAETKENIAGLRSQLSNMFTPDERQREVVLNLYTLRIYSHMATLIGMHLDAMELEPELDSFARTVCSGIPVPPTPGSTEAEAPQLEYALPERYHELLVDFGNRVNLPIKESDFEMAAAGDLERALMILKVVLTKQESIRNPDASKAADPLTDLARLI